MRVLITGVAGFVGRHVAREFASGGFDLAGLDLGPAAPGGPARHYAADLAQAAEVARAVADFEPDACVHLAGIASPPAGARNPTALFEANVIGTLRVLEAMRRRPGARVLVASTAQVYGNAPRERPAAEDDPLAPGSLYALSKAAADQLALRYHAEFGLAAMTARPHNHIGPGQSPDYSVASFARQVAAIAAGRQPPRIVAGNLASTRDFTDVRDVARAYRLLIERGRPGQAYNIASGRPVALRDILGRLCALAGVDAEIATDPDRLRPTDSSVPLDCSRIRLETGWEPLIPLGQSLCDILAEAR